MCISRSVLNLLGLGRHLRAFSAHMRLSHDQQDVDTAGPTTNHFPEHQCMRSVQEWGLMVGGSKPELWDRLSAQVEPVHAVLCPVARATRTRAEELKGERVR